MKKILIFINDSLGELDWITPFITSAEAKEFMFYVYFNEIGTNLEEKKEIFKKYGLEKKNIQLLSNDKYDLKFSKLDNFFNRGLTKIKKHSYHAFVFLRFVIDYLRLLKGFIFKKSDKFEFIFRDYNLKDSISLNRFITNNIKAKIVVYPHSIGIQKKHSQCPRETLKKVKADLWLENTVESNIAEDQYEHILYPVGSPTVSENYKKDKLFNSESTNIIILTRVCIDEYGFNFEEGLGAFEVLLKSLNRYNVYIKHHPRDNNLEKWRSIQSKFNNIFEYNNTLNDVELNLKACFTLFSSAPIFLLSRGIPVFEFSPYKKYHEYKYRMPLHFKHKHNELLTHDFIDLDLFYMIGLDENIDILLETVNLTKIAERQFKKCIEIFPKNSNFNIYNRLLNL